MRKSYLIASGQLQVNTTDYLFTGELSLDGRLRYTTGILPLALLARERHIKQFFVPKENAKEAAFIAGIDVIPVENLQQLFLHLSGQKQIEPQPLSEIENTTNMTYTYDMKDIQGQGQGQEQAKRALEIAAAGSHNILLKGPPGAGKTLLARTLPSIMPQMTFPEMLETTKIYSIAGMLNGKGVLTTRPFRAPHHTTSHVGLIGGGSIPKPGEISLAHRGVLFLDELPEFPRTVTESLRQPLEDGMVSISRAQGRVTFPAKSMLVAAENPCPCGFYGDPTHTCTCAHSMVIKYQKKISGPMLDRIDIHLDVPAVKVEKLATTDTSHNEPSEIVRKRVQIARDMQTKRFIGTSLSSNSDMASKDIKIFCPLAKDCVSLLHTAVEKMNLSARSYHRTIKLARTIADLDQAEIIQQTHIAEALQYRPKRDFQ